MTSAQTLDSGDCVAGVAETLMGEFHRVLPLSTVTSVVLRARRELAGLERDVRFHEVLVRVSRARLTRLQLELTA